MKNSLNSIQLSLNTFTFQLPEILRNMAGFLNSEINTNTLTKHQNSDSDPKQEFAVSVETSSAKLAAKLISEALESFDCVAKKEEKPVKVTVDAFSSNKVELRVVFWIDATTFKGSQPDKKYEIMHSAFDNLERKGIKYSW